MVAGKARRNVKERLCACEIFISHFHERTDAPRIDHTAQYPRRTRLEAPRQHPNELLAMSRRCTARHRIEDRVPLGADRPRVIQQLLTDDKKIVIAIRPIGAARAAAKQNDGAWVQSFREQAYRLRKSGILCRLLSHLRYISGAEPKSK